MLIGYARVSKADGKGLAAFVVLLSLAFAACGGDKQSSPTAPTPPTSSNQAPQASGSIPAQELTVGAAAGMVDVAQYFSDPAGDALTYAADSNDAGTVTASVSGSILTLTPVAGRDGDRDGHRTRPRRFERNADHRCDGSAVMCGRKGARGESFGFRL